MAAVGFVLRVSPPPCLAGIRTSSRTRFNLRCSPVLALARLPRVSPVLAAFSPLFLHQALSQGRRISAPNPGPTPSHLLRNHFLWAWHFIRGCLGRGGGSANRWFPLPEPRPFGVGLLAGATAAAPRHQPSSLGARSGPCRWEPGSCFPSQLESSLRWGYLFSLPLFWLLLSFQLNPVPLERL